MSDFSHSHNVNHTDTLLLDRSVIHVSHKHKNVKVEHYLKGTSSIEKISFDGDTLYLTTKKNGLERKVSSRKDLNRYPSRRDFIRRIIEDIDSQVLKPLLRDLNHLVGELGNSHRDQNMIEGERRNGIHVLCKDKNIAPTIYQQALVILEMLDEFQHVGYWDDTEDDGSGGFLERSSQWPSEFILLDGKVFKILYLLRGTLNKNQKREDHLTRSFLHEVFNLISELSQHLKERATHQNHKYVDNSYAFEEPIKTILYILHLLKDNEKESEDD